MRRDYTKYSLAQLYEVEACIDGKKYPDRLATIKAEIVLREMDKHGNQISRYLLDIEDEIGTHLVVERADTDSFLLKLTVAFKSLLSVEVRDFNFLFEKSELKKFIANLKQGTLYSFSNKSWLGANTIYMCNQNHPAAFRNIWLYRRWFIFGFVLTPAALTKQIVEALYVLEEELE